jgi:hypothetical protein
VRDDPLDQVQIGGQQRRALVIHGQSPCGWACTGPEA